VSSKFSSDQVLHRNDVQVSVTLSLLVTRLVSEIIVFCCLKRVNVSFVFAIKFEGEREFGTNTENRLKPLCIFSDLLFSKIYFLKVPQKKNVNGDVVYMNVNLFLIGNQQTIPQMTTMIYIKKGTKFNFWEEVQLLEWM